MLKGFKEFISRGNAIDLAVGMVIGAAFTAVVTALVKQVINPLIGGLFGEQNFDDVFQFTVGTATVQPGAVITALVNFLLVTFALYFFIVLPMRRPPRSAKMFSCSRRSATCLRLRTTTDCSPENVTVVATLWLPPPLLYSTAPLRSVLARAEARSLSTAEYSTDPLRQQYEPYRQRLGVPDHSPVPQEKWGSPGRSSAHPPR